MTKPTSASWSPEFSRTRDTQPALPRTASRALSAIEERKPSLLILDIWLQGSQLDGLEILSRVKAQHPDLPVVIISGHGNIETAVTAIKRGAYDYIEKPFKADRLVLVTARALENSKLKRENRELKEKSVVSFELIGKSTAINQLRQAIERVAATNSRIMITGPVRLGQGAGRARPACQLAPRQRAVCRRERCGDGA